MAVPRQLAWVVNKYLYQIYQKLTPVNIIILIISVLLSFYIYDITYVWQCTSLASVLHPVTRDNCAVKSLANSNPSSLPKYKIGLIMMYDNKDGNWNNELMQRVLRNRESYAKRYGYTMINANDLIDKSRPPAWSKLIAMEKHLASNQYDYLLYMDMDVVVMNPEVRLESFVEPGFDFVMTNDRSGLNTGIWFAKSTDFAKWFLRTAWDQSQLLERRSVGGQKHPFEYEQRAFHFLTYSRVWQERGLPKYRGMDSKEMLKHFYMQPQCAFNSYVLHPLDTGDRESSQYVSGDLLVHFAGKKGQRRVDLMEHYLDIAEQAEKKVDGGK